MHGLNQYDFHARQYDMARLQFTSVDPFAEKYYSWSPYNYCANNPLKYVDSDGKQFGYPFIQGTSQQIQKDAIGQKHPQMGTGSTSWEAFTRGVKAVGAFTISLSGKVAAFFSAEGEINATLIVSGEDKGLHGYASGSLGVEKDVNISASAIMEVVKPDNTEKFTGKDLEGPSTKTSIEIPVKKVLNGAANISVIGSSTKAESVNAGKIDSYGAGLSVGFGVKKIFGGLLDKFNISTQKTNAKEFNTNSYKNEEEKR